MLKKIVCFIAAVVFATLLVAPAKSKASKQSITSAQAAVMLEYSTNTVLYSKNAHEKLPMASTTKVMTAIVAIENGNLDDMVTTVDEAYGVEGSSIYLCKNEKISLRDLLYGLMLRSGNDAAVAIAYHIGGDINGFVGMMNNKAKQIGAANTNFTNPNGLPDNNHYTTAYDLGIICSYALKNETFKNIVSSQYYVAESGDVKRTMMNKNKLLWQYDGAIGIKTGYTTAAGKCLTFAADKNNMTVVGVVLNCVNMFSDSIELMDWCYENYEMYNVVKKGTIVMRSQINHSNTLAAFITDTDIFVPVKKSEGIKLTTNINIKENIAAPLSAGFNVGVLELHCEDRLIASCNLLCAENVKPISIRYYFEKIALKMVS